MGYNMDGAPSDSTLLSHKQESEATVGTSLLKLDSWKLENYADGRVRNWCYGVGNVYLAYIWPTKHHLDATAYLNIVADYIHPL